MGYREGSAPEVALGSAVLVAWRCFIGALGVAGVAVAEHVALGSDLALLALFSAALVLAEVARTARWVSAGARGARIVVVERRLGRAIVREVSAAGMRGVITDEREVESWLAPLDPSLRGATIVLTAEDGTELALTSHLPGAPRVSALAARIAAHLALPAPTARVRTLRRPDHQRAALVAHAALTLVVLAIPAFAALELRLTADEGRLALICSERCSFGGIDCLPGGSLEGSYAPGHYEIVVEGFEVHRVPVVIGHRTTFECRRGARTPVPVPDR